MKTYECHRAKRKMTLDGNLVKDVWKTAKKIGLVDVVTGSAPSEETLVSLLWDDEFLYIAFDCVDTEIRAELTGFNDPIYDEDVVEIYIDDNNDMRTYLEFEINPLNAVLHYMIANNQRGGYTGYARLSNNILSRVVRNDEENRTWYEIAVPFSEFQTSDNAPPKPGDSWRANFFRVDRRADGYDEYTAWSPTGKKDFHKPECFGEIRFMA